MGAYKTCFYTSGFKINDFDGACMVVAKYEYVRVGPRSTDRFIELAKSLVLFRHALNVLAVETSFSMIKVCFALRPERFHLLVKFAHSLINLRMLHSNFSKIKSSNFYSANY